MTPLSSKIKDVLKNMDPRHPAHSELRSVLDIVRRASCSHSMSSQPLSQQNVDNRKRSYERSNAASTSSAKVPQASHLPTAQPTKVRQQCTATFKRPNLNVPVSKRSSPSATPHGESQSTQPLQLKTTNQKLPPQNRTGCHVKNAINYTMVQIPQSPFFSKSSATSNRINSHTGEAATKNPWPESLTASSSLKKSNMDNAEPRNELLQNIPYDEMINFLRSEFNRDEKLQKDLIKIVFKK